MRLELITRTSTHESRPTPLLFVHGAYCAAWVWDRHFLPFFADRGYQAHALSLRGHGASEGHERLWSWRLRDYVADVEQVAAALPRPPVLIGHSMGGLVVQQVLHRRPVPAAVLLAPVPPHGLLGSLLGIALTDPELHRQLAWAQTLGPRSVTGGAVRRALFSDDGRSGDGEVRGYLERFQPESLLVLFDLLGLDLPPSLPRLDLPVLVLGAEHDGFLPAFSGALQTTARTYRTRAEVLPGLAHAMMLDRGWEAVARRIGDWLDTTLGDGTGRRGVVPGE
jgi:pimeloyl-ACP methyl ester carboxylesterase